MYIEELQQHRSFKNVQDISEWVEYNLQPFGPNGTQPFYWKSFEVDDNDCITTKVCNLSMIGGYLLIDLSKSPCCEENFS